jgi:hypothetical protein
MIRLNLSREPRRLDLGHGVAVTVLPATSALMMAARRDATLQPDASNDERISRLVKAIGRLAITEWDGVGDEDGNPVEPSPERVDALLDLWPMAEAFQRVYLGPALLLDEEKNVSALSPTGILVGAQTTAQLASANAQNAPMS